MDIENTDGLIISGGPENREANKGENEKAENIRKNGRREKAVNKTSPQRRLRLPKLHGFSARERLRGAIKGRSKRFLAVCAGAAAMTVGLSALSTFCTVGVDYYYGGRLLCTVAAADDSAAIIGAAAQQADLLGVDEPDIQVSAKLALKKDIVDGDEAIDKILNASPELCHGWIVSAGGTDLFAAEDMETIDEALDFYLKKHGWNDDSKFSSDIAVRDQLIRRDELTAAGDIIPLLEEGGVLTVLNTITNVEYAPIPYDTTEVDDPNLYMGDTEVETPGIEGQTATTVQRLYSNDELLSASVVSSETVTEPVNEVIRVGTKARNALADGLSYPLPVKGVLTSSFGPRWGREHRGVDLAVDLGTSVYAAAAGTVITAKYNESYGNYVQIDHGYGIVTTYAHLSSIGVELGQTVDRGQLIALSGSTGNSTGPHLHFEVIDNGTYLNPLDHLI